MIKSRHYIRKKGKKVQKKGYILGTWLLSQQVLGAGIMDISSIVNIADIVINISDIAGIANRVLQTLR